MGGFLHSVFDGIERSTKKLEQDFTAARLAYVAVVVSGTVMSGVFMSGVVMSELCLVLLCLALCIVHSLGYTYIRTVLAITPVCGSHPFVK